MVIIRAIYIPILLSFLFFSLCSCGSLQTKYEKGKYNAVISKVGKKVSKGKAKRSHVILAQRSMEKLDQEIYDEISLLKESNKLNDLDRAYTLYDKLINKYGKFEKVLRFDSKRREELMQQREWLKDDLVDINMSMGLDLMAAYEDNNDKFAAQEAYYHFKDVQQYDPNIEELHELIDDAYDKGVINCLVNVSDSNVSINSLSGFDRFDREFLEVEEGFVCHNCDCEIKIYVDFINLREERFNDTESFNKEVQDGYTSVTDTSGVVKQIPKYVNVSAEIITTTVRKIGIIRSNYNTFQHTNNCSFTGSKSYRFETESEGKSQRINGDQRAIPSGYIINDKNPESDQQMKRRLYSILNEALLRDIRLN